MTALITAFIALMSALGSFVTIEVDQVMPAPATMLSQAKTRCYGDSATVFVSNRDPFQAWVHELTHAYDCMDNGVMDASPLNGRNGWRPAERPSWAMDYCWISDVEWYACYVTYSGDVSSLRP